MLVNILHFIKLPASVKNPKTKKLYMRIERLGYRTPNTFFLTEESKNTQTTGPSARKAEISLFTVPDLDLSNDSHLAHRVIRCQSTAKVSFPSYIPKNTGETAIVFVHYCSKEDTLMPIICVLEWHIPGRCCDVGWILLQQKDRPHTLHWTCSRSPAKARVASKSHLQGSL